ncbi:MAG: 4-alpha-glucanotransferase, partial [Elusimicrobiaceae bacterium]|nr:4-alpha-glucanotransferase [Elusimicrobiaceae bacterium]
MIDLSKNPYLQKRSAGVSLPLSAMKGAEDWGCGDMSSLRDWIEYFSNYNIKVLQILPLWETSPREHCPYSALSAYAIDPIYVSIKDVPEIQKSPKAQEILNDLKPEIEKWRANSSVQFDT